MKNTEVPASRIHPCNPRAHNGRGSYVLYWMIATRRRQWNFALQRAVHWASELRKPLLIVEALSCRYRWASTRFHTVILQGMRDNLGSFEGSGVLYHPFVERFPFHGKDMMKELARNACVVVTDDYPCFELPRWIAIAAANSPVLLEKVDSNGIFPMRATDRVFVRAHNFRQFLQKELDQHLKDVPITDPLAGIDLPTMSRPPLLRRQWKAATAMELSDPETLAETIPVDHSVRAVAEFAGGPVAARRRLKRFVRRGLESYPEARNQPELEGTSRLSADLHFGHLSAHEIFTTIKSTRVNADAFLDQLVTWRELGFNLCAHSSDYDRYSSLPGWARETLARHAGDPRPVLYSRAQLEGAGTHDTLWNAAQTQLLQEGRIHNYLRMLWGKKILEWSPAPEEALKTMIHLNNKYALDGRDPNSYSGIFWILGRYDRAWGPRRPIFGTVRYMSSENTARKLRVKNYIQRYSGAR